jgi:hypothetical protein
MDYRTASEAVARQAQARGSINQSQRLARTAAFLGNARVASSRAWARAGR